MESTTETEQGARAKVPRPDRRTWPSAYETVFVLPNDQTDEAADKVAERLKGIVTANDGRVVKFTFWGRRKTAFDVKKSGRALYVQMDYLGRGKTVDEIERHLRNSEEVVRFQSSRVAKFVDPESRPTEADVRLQGDVDERPARPERMEGVAPGGHDEIESVPEEAAEEPVPEAE